MITGFDIRNFKCFQHLKVEQCKRINVIVGDNGAGKTALLEAVFMALGGTTEMVLRFRQQRGLDGAFRGSSRKISDAILGDLFYNLNQKNPISISLTGTGPEARSLSITHGPSEARIPLNDSEQRQSTAPFRFTWKDFRNREHKLIPNITPSGLQFPETGEDLPDFFYFAANQMYSSTENAERFSELSRAKRQNDFIQLFKKEYKWIDDIGIEVMAGAPAIYASIVGIQDKISISNVSGGINRIVTVLLGISSRPQSVVLVDELENGLYYKHHQSYWHAILSFARSYDSQVFATTHNEEWIKSLIQAANGNYADISLWRLERSETGQPELFQFSGEAVKDGIEQGAEVRGGAED